MAHAFGDTALVLASASPRRRELLLRAGLRFEVRPSEVDEARRIGEEAASYAERIAREKALAVSVVAPHPLVLGADTVVECAGEILGKPSDQREACAMLRTLSGKTHRVITGYALARGGRILESAAVTSRVTFHELSSVEIEHYVASGEPMDKAGAYGIQGLGGGFIAHVEGSCDNVMGLPLAAVVAALARHRIVAS